jgi:succinylglutamic semialdehyde dehydrogenase
MGSNVTSIEPATGEFLWMGEIGDVDAEVAAARSAWSAWAARSATYRSEALRRFANVVRGHKDKFADLIARETGKPLWEAATEVDAVVNKVDISISAYRERTPNRKLEGALGAKVSVRHRPHGVLGVLGPYNFPAHLPNGHIVPALLAGNAVVFKPSEKTPAVGQFLVQMFHEAGIPEGVVRLLIGGPDEGRALAGHPGIDGLLFTGSARAGLALSRQFAEMPNKILALELGGNNPLVIWKAPDPYQAAAIAIQSAFLSAGQRCTAARRLIVEDGEHDELLDALLKTANRLIVDKPHANPAPFMGPVIDNQAADQLQEAFLDLVMRGGRAFKHLDRLSNDKPFLSPAVIDVTDVQDRPDVELFGPVLQVIRVPDFDAAIREANNTRYGLAASLVGGSPQLYDKFWANIRAGVVNWNKPTNGAPSNAPFGGVGLSGNHRPSAYYAADYCAYPVTSSEVEQVRASIGVGLADPNIEKDEEPPLRAVPAPTPDLAKAANEPNAEAEEAAAAAEEAERLAAEAKAAEEARLAEEAAEAQRAAAEAEAAAERARREEEERIAEEARLAEARAAEEARLAKEARAAEEARLAQQVRAAQEARLAEEARAAEEARLAEGARIAQEARLAEEARAAEEARLAEEAWIAEEARAVEAARAAEAKAAEEARLAEEARAAEAARAEAEARVAPLPPPLRSSAPRGPVMPMLDATAERQADQVETGAGRRPPERPRRR